MEGRLCQFKIPGPVQDTGAGSRYRVIAMAPPWVAAQYTVRGQPATLNRAMPLHRLNRILRARRGIAARRRQYPRRPQLPAARNQDEQAFHRNAKLIKMTRAETQRPQRRERGFRTAGASNIQSVEHDWECSSVTGLRPSLSPLRSLRLCARKSCYFRRRGGSLLPAVARSSAATSSSRSFAKSRSTPVSRPIST